ncbi:MAG: hypothetical protein AB7V55_03550, partial [Oscillospiraceae bacterium]
VGQPPQNISLKAPAACVPAAHPGAHGLASSANPVRTVHYKKISHTAAFFIVSALFSSVNNTMLKHF